MPGFAGLKLCQDDASQHYCAVHKITVERGVNDLLLHRAGVVGSAQNGGFQALNLALQFGARFIILVGFDMGLGQDGAVHWHGHHPSGLRNPKPATLEIWRDRLDGQAKRLRSMGVEVVNVSDTSALRAYPKMTMAAALERFEACRRLCA